MERCLEIISEGMCVITVILKRHLIRCLGGCDLDKSYDGPKLDVDEEGKYRITHDFIKGMIEYFKTGKTLPRRYVGVTIMLYCSQCDRKGIDMSGRS